MSRAGKRNDVAYGGRTFGLSTSRTDQLIQLPMVTSVTVLKSESPATARFGDNDNAAIQLQDLATIKFENPIDQMYLTNSSGSGDLELLFGQQGLEADANVPDEIDVTDRSGRDAGKVRVQDSSGTLIDPAEEGTLTNTLSRDVAQIGGQSQSAVDVADKIDQLEDALTSVGTDQLRVDIENDNSTSTDDVNVTDRAARDLGQVDVVNTPTVTDDGSFNVAGTVSVQEASALDVSGATVTVDEAATGQNTSQTGTPGTNISLDLGDRRKAVDIGVDTSGSATLTIEVSHDGTFSGEEFTFDSVDVSSTDDVIQADIGFQHVRCSVNQNLNSLRIVARGG